MGRTAVCHADRVHYGLGLCHTCYTRTWYRKRGSGYMRAQNLKSKYGITVEEYDRMFESQGGRCAICRQDRPPLHVDHDHETGRVRGLLCNSCNNGLGRFAHDPIVLVAASQYMATT